MAIRGHGKTGTTTGGRETAPWRKTRDAEARKRQEKRWAKKSGPVTTRFVCPECGGPHSRADHPSA
jgi:hypothetical protein